MRALDAGARRAWCGTVSQPDPVLSTEVRAVSQRVQLVQKPAYHPRWYVVMRAAGDG
jgi:hypothetical protein